MIDSSLRQYVAGLAVLTVLAGCAVSCTYQGAGDGGTVVRETLRVGLPSGDAIMDVYLPDTGEPAPLVIIAHGFARRRHNMSGWGRHLAEAGMVAAVPGLPTVSNHARNSRFVSELQDYFRTDAAWRDRIDPTRIGLMGYSAGGLVTLLSAADSPELTIWVGLDPVDRDGMGTLAAAQVQAHAVVITADPSECNANGNARDIIAALPRCDHFQISGAVHVDAEWPTSGLAELVCGKSTEEKRRAFHLRATEALLEAFGLKNNP